MKLMHAVRCHACISQLANAITSVNVEFRFSPYQVELMCLAAVGLHFNNQAATLFVNVHSS